MLTHKETPCLHTNVHSGLSRIVCDNKPIIGHHAHHKYLIKSHAKLLLQSYSHDGQFQSIPFTKLNVKYQICPYARAVKSNNSVENVFLP